jgi:hypothetical protein
MWRYQQAIRNGTGDVSALDQSAGPTPAASTDASNQTHFRNAKDLWMHARAGQVTPGQESSALRTAQGALAWGAGRKYKWLRKTKLGLPSPTSSEPAHV